MGKRQKIKKKPKLEIVFDEKARKEFLTGFRKRKNERRKRAKVELEEMVKAERKRIRLEVKSGLQNLKRSFAPLPIEDDITRKTEYDEEEVTVKIVELTNKEIAKKENFLGMNCPEPSDNEADENEDTESSEDEVIPGMSMHVKKPKAKLVDEETNEKKNEDIKNKKDLDKFTKDKIMKSMKKSKIMKMKVRVDQLENRKLHKRNKNKEIKQLKSQGRRIEKKPNFRKLNAVRGKNPHKKKHKKGK